MTPVESYLVDPRQLRNHGLEEVLDGTEATLARVDRALRQQERRSP